MNKKSTYLFISFLLCTSSAIGQPDEILLLENIEKKIENADNEKDTSALILELIGGVDAFTSHGVEEKALTYFGRLVAFPLHFTQEQRQMSVAYEKVAQIYCRKKEYFIAATYIERAIKIAQKMPQTSEEIRLSQSLCDILLLGKNNENQQELQEVFKKIDFLLPKNNSEPFLATYDRQKGTFYLLQKNYGEAIFYLEKAIPIFEKNKNITESIQCYQLLSEAYQSKENSKKSLYFLQKYITEKEKITPHSHNFKDVYESRKKDKTLIFNTVGEERQAQKIEWAKVTIAAMLGVIFLMILVFWYYRKKAKQKIKLQNLSLQTVMNELKAFNYSVSHDLKAPLVEMYNSLSRIDKTESEKLNPNSQAQLRFISQTILNTRKMIDEMLSYSSSDNHSFEPQKFEMIELIEDLLFQFSDTIKSKSIEVRVAPNFPQVYGDLAMIRQVFQNLISNAIKFSQNNPAPMLLLDYKKEKARFVFSVSDNGIGFDERYKSKLFQLFKRLPTKEKFEGIGAGLAIVKRIVERHGGEVWAEGSPNNGAVFYFSLPKLS